MEEWGEEMQSVQRERASKGAIRGSGRVGRGNAERAARKSSVKKQREEEGATG